MRRRQPTARGFTLIEMAVVVAIIAVITGLAWSSLGSQRRRASFANVGNELQTLLHEARMRAISSGHSVVVAVNTGFVTPGGGIGRVVSFEDPGGLFFDATGALNLGNYNWASPGFTSLDPADPGVGVYDLPPGFSFAAPPATLVMQPPFAAVPVGAACTFCGAGGVGGIRFDERGRAYFYDAVGPVPALVTGRSLTVWNGDARVAPLDLIAGFRTLVITGATGAVLTFNNG